MAVTIIRGGKEYKPTQEEIEKELEALANDAAKMDAYWKDQFGQLQLKAQQANESLMAQLTPITAVSQQSLNQILQEYQQKRVFLKDQMYEAANLRMSAQIPSLKGTWDSFKVTLTDLFKDDSTRQISQPVSKASEYQVSESWLQRLIADFQEKEPKEKRELILFWVAIAALIVEILK
jgi:hypothetical protein